ncbi:hypothetical protein WJX74_006795 [Apatococcus lobatus]|uniref:Uncharacterized protein n=1 Tax=Apatococcus lobatus TaxID=904363 RepID=A0AAW1QKB7_9CHLO
MLSAAVTVWLVGVVFWLVFHKIQSSTSTSPVVGGWPLLGCLIPFATQGAAFISSCRLQYGDMFQLCLPGQKIVFLFHPDAIQAFFQSPDSKISFRLAVERFTQRVFGLPSKDFFPQHMAMLDALRGLLTPLHLHELAKVQLAAMEEAADVVLPCEGEVELMEAVNQILTPAAIKMLFGSAFLEEHGPENVLRAFATFESGFELAASPVPHWLQRGWCKSRAWLLSAFRQSLAEGHFRGQLVDQLLQQVPMPEHAVPHVLLAVLWASLANTIPATFWTLAYLLQPEQWHQLAEVQQLLSQLGNNLQQPVSEAHAHLIQAGCFTTQYKAWGLRQ